MDTFYTVTDDLMITCRDLSSTFRHPFPYAAEYIRQVAVEDTLDLDKGLLVVSKIIFVPVVHCKNTYVPWVSLCGDDVKTKHRILCFSPDFHTIPVSRPKGRMLRIQVEQIDLDFDLVSVEGLPLPFRIKQAKGSSTSSTVQYLLETPAEAATAPRDYEKMTSDLAGSLGKSLGTFGTFKALESLELPESHLPEGCCFLDDGPNLPHLDRVGASTISNLAHGVDRRLQVDRAGAGASTMTNLAHRVDLQVDRPVQVQTGRARMRSSETELVAEREGKRPAPAARGLAEPSWAGPSWMTVSGPSKASRIPSLAVPSSPSEPSMEPQTIAGSPKPSKPSEPSMEPQTTAGSSKPLKPKTKGKKLSEQEKAERRSQRKRVALERKLVSLSTQMIQIQAEIDARDQADQAAAQDRAELDADILALLEVEEEEDELGE